jgi:hypothetical protein
MLRSVLLSPITVPSSNFSVDWSYSRCDDITIAADFGYRARTDPDRRFTRMPGTRLVLGPRGARTRGPGKTIILGLNYTNTSEHCPN